MFSEYINHGWKLCRIEPGSKSPRYRGWNEEFNAITISKGVEAAGLMHAYSGTCALDIDRLDDTLKFMPEIADLLMAPDAVQISSGQPNRGKLIYAMPKPRPSKSFAAGAFELRCGTGTSKTAQDVLPPSPHPSGSIYKWIGDWKTLPPIPESLLAIWRIGESSLVASNRSQSLNELRDLLSRRDPGAGYDEWLKIGMAIHHESEGSDEGFTLWNEWSAPSDKYRGTADLRSHWLSFGRSATPITLDSLRRNDVASIEEFELLSDGEGVREKPSRRSGFLELDELFARPEPDWIIKGLLPENGLGVVWGQPSSGKTFVVIDIALRVALGLPWYGHSVKQGSVLYIAAEDDSGVQMRFHAALAAYGVQKAPIRVMPAAPVFTSPKQAEALLDDIKAQGKQSLVFVDTLAAVTPGSDENAAKDMGILIAFCQKIHKASGGLVVLVHHEGKTPGKGMRGSSVIPGASEVTLEVTDQEDHREMRVSKQKNAPLGNISQFQLRLFGESCIVDWL